MTLERSGDVRTQKKHMAGDVRPLETILDGRECGRSHIIILATEIHTMKNDNATPRRFDSIIDGLSDKHVTIICNLINIYGSADHPVADEKTLPQFSVEYARGLFDLVLDHPDVPQSESTKIAVTAARDALDAALAIVPDVEQMMTEDEEEAKPDVRKTFVRNAYIDEHARARVLEIVTREAAFGESVGFRYLCGQIATHPTTIRAAVGALIARGDIIEAADGIYELAPEPDAETTNAQKPALDGEAIEAKRVAMRDVVKPYAIMKTKTGRDVEIMSFPFNAEDSADFIVFARTTIGDPTSAKYINVNTLDI